MTTIDTNMSLVMIDPNEPLELYDGTIIKGRLEWFLYALCCLDYGNLPTPLSRIEEWANALITNELPNMEPQSRAEEFFKAILTGDTSNLPTPQSRSEVLLDKLARGENDFTNVEKIQSRYEFLLAYLIKNGGGIGNIDYVLYKFQKEDETLYNTKERPVKSAILSGNTLVNLSPKYNGEKTIFFSVDGSGFTSEYNNDYYKITANGANCNIALRLYANANWQTTQSLKLNTTYLAIVDLDVQVSKNISLQCGKVSYSGVYGKTGIPNNGRQRVALKFTTPSEIDGTINIGTDLYSNSGDYVAFYSIMLIEYQEGMENWDIPYFEGMQSVKMPVLTTVGKNLFDGKLKVGNVQSNDGAINQYTNHMRTTDFIKINANKTITISKLNNSNIDFRVEKVAYYDTNKNFIGVNGELFMFPKSVTPPMGVAYIRVVFCKGRWDETATEEDFKTLQVQIEEGSIATSYEPYKSNILTVNEDIELRGVGDVQDTLDLLTGEFNSNFKKTTLDSNVELYHFNYNEQENTVLSRIRINDFKNNGKIICDKLKTTSLWGNDVEGIEILNDAMQIRLLKSRLSDISEQSFKEVIDILNPTIIYETEKSVKTVDLSIVDQGGATIPKLKTFDKITHVNVSATDILPEVEMEVATTIGEDLSGTLYSTMEDIETKQEALKESNNAQTESINSTMMATTEIYESLL